MLIKEIKAKTALHKIKSRFPYQYDLNIYRGCGHRCIYCYALYSHQYLDEAKKNEFYKTIYVKKNLPEILEKELSKKRNINNEIINLGGVTDSYQPIEQKYKLTREILKIFLKYRQPITISTKSDLIIRDYDLLTKLAKYTYVNIALTITSSNDITQKFIEPNAVSNKKRWQVLKVFKDTKVSRGLHMMPILPFITDKKDNLENLYLNAKKAKVDYVFTGLLNLIGKTKIYFMNKILSKEPELYKKYLKLYKTGKINQEYKDKFYLMVSEIRKKYNINNNFKENFKEKKGQLF